MSGNVSRLRDIKRDLATGRLGHLASDKNCREPLSRGRRVTLAVLVERPYEAVEIAETLRRIADRLDAQ